MVQALHNNIQVQHKYTSLTYLTNTTEIKPYVSALFLLDTCYLDQKNKQTNKQTKQTQKTKNKNKNENNNKKQQQQQQQQNRIFNI